MIIVIPLLELNSKDSSPYELKYTEDCIFLGADLGLIGLNYYLSQNIKTISPEEILALNVKDINIFDRHAAYNWSPTSSNISDYLLYTSVISPLTLMLSDKIRDDALVLLVMFVESSITAGIGSLALKATSRLRPFTYNKDVSLEKKIELQESIPQSFPSGHAAWSFSSAVFLSTVYSDYFPDSKWIPYIWLSSLTAASTVSFLRYHAGYHYPSDILAGAVIGSVIGYLIPYTHRVNDSDEKGFSVDLNPTQLNLSYKF